MSEPLVIAVDDNGEFQLPDEIMDHYSWGPGSRLALEVIPGGLLIKTAPIEGHDSEPEA
jgi:bifunctional DNA-binding transcriptional regulator/antitoxin component of YhaV-PrlF toxin-antitoxin module